MRKIKVLFIMPNVEPHFIKIPGTIKFIKSLIGKNLDFIRLSDNTYIAGNKDANIDDFNRVLGDSVLRGNFLILNIKNQKVCSLNKKQLRKCTNMFKLRRHQKRLERYADIFATYTIKLIKNYYQKNDNTQNRLSA